jgi:hypothetical protein
MSNETLKRAAVTDTKRLITVLRKHVDDLDATIISESKINHDQTLRVMGSIQAVLDVIEMNIDVVKRVTNL